VKTAILLVDVQESFRARQYWSETDLPRFLDRVNALVRGAAERGVPVVRVLHTDGPDEPGNPFARSSGKIRPLEGLGAFAPAHEVEKHRHSALVGTDLSVWLRERGIGRVVVAGIRTEQCCETTARHASDEGFEVDFVSEATLTFDMRLLDGAPLPAAAIRSRTEAVLEGRFARVCTVEQALERAR
jgi:nicotinamidase-related amidase